MDGIPSVAKTRRFNGQPCYDIDVFVLFVSSPVVVSHLRRLVRRKRRGGCRDVLRASRQDVVDLHVLDHLLRDFRQNLEAYVCGRHVSGTMGILNDTPYHNSENAMYVSS